MTSRKRYTFGTPALVAAMIAACLVYMAPTGYGLVRAVAFVGNAGQAGISWYDHLVENRRLMSAIGQSALVSTIVAALAPMLCVMGLHSYRRLSRRTQRLVLGLALLPLFVPETTQALTLSRSLFTIHIPKGTAAVVLGQLVYVLPFTAIVILLQVSALPDGVFRAARDLGLSVISYGRSVVLPLTWRAIAAASVFAFLLSFNEFTRTNYLARKELYSVFLYGQVAGGGNDAVYLVSACMFLVGIGLFSVLLLQQKRYLDDE